ncbi:hypothetical protein EDB92DRAFT_81268 [Lactarius akahatsu]|uniref:Myb/SANT-like domain-containing protein n=1 Tax=Lactarius akahatsu TaxID=416441 RepID=A0AAD4LRY3_9AGAM|nr:hypothetical protein EDB92DRAFT_81268 [Lactarius akahatsu]
MAYVGQVEWSRDDEATLVRTLAEEKAKGNWGGNIPKAAAWTTCQLALVDSEKKSGGGAKTIESIKSRWQRFKQEFNTVKELRAASGFMWNDQEKIVRAPADVWDAYVKTHPYANKFRKKRFPLYDPIADLVSNSGIRTTGRDPVRPGQYAFNADQKSAIQRDRPPFLIPRSPDKEYNSSEDDEQATLGSLPSHRKRSRSAGTSASQRQKKPRVSFDQGMSELVSAFAKVVDAMKSGLLSTSCPEPSKTSADGGDLLTRAIIALENDGGLSDKELAEAAHYFMTDRDVARVYVALQTTRARSHFLQYKLEIWRKKL